ncbi:MAG: ABC transporter ATP-binding protein [Clostridia bacterium]|nr:ABC transporter ATP-binding protein [Clostridia bacterium]
MHIEVSKLTKVYRPNVTALSDVDLTIGAGMFGLLGPNGAGKTTLMRILAALHDPTSGSVTVDGVQLARNKEAVRRKLGYLPQNFGLYPRLTAWETLGYIGSLKGLFNGADRRRRIQQVLEIVNLWGDRRRRVREFSGGMLQRLGIAQALLGDPSLLIVDEPTAGLDPEERIRFRNLLSMMSGDRVVLLSTHIVADVESTCSNMAVIRKGRIVFRGSPAQLITEARGKVWEVRCRRDAFERLSAGSNITVVGARNSGDMVEARVVSAAAPVLGDGASTSPAAEPTLEDAYIALMEAM